MADQAPRHRAATSPAGRAKLVRLSAIVEARSLFKGEEFHLTSGTQTRFYFDMKGTVFDPEGASLIADLILEALASDEVDAIGGLELGAVPIAACVSQRSFQVGRPLRAFFVRKQAKQHGTMRHVEGPLEPGMRVVVVEDVTTTGGSALKAVEAVRSFGCSVDRVITLVDRLEGATEAFAVQSIELIALLTASDFNLAV